MTPAWVREIEREGGVEAREVGGRETDTGKHTERKRQRDENTKTETDKSQKPKQRHRDKSQKDRFP